MKTNPIIFTFIWSVILFVSTFPKVVFECSIEDLYSTDIKQSIITPIVILLALYLWEEMYNIQNVNITNDKLKESFWKTLLILGLVLIFLIITINVGQYRFIPFVICWVLISLLKYISITIANTSTELNKIS